MLISERFAEGEALTGNVDGSNAIFGLARIPDPTTSLELYVCGMFQTAGGEDYTLSNSTITFVNAPVMGSIIKAFYRY